MYPESRADNMRLGKLSDNRHDPEKYEKSYARAHVSRDKCDQPPRDQHRTDAEHRQKVNKRNDKRKYQRILYSDHGKSEVKLCKDEKHHDEVCLEIFPERIRYAVLPQNQPSAHPLRNDLSERSEKIPAVKREIKNRR